MSEHPCASKGWAHPQPEFVASAAGRSAGHMESCAHLVRRCPSGICRHSETQSDAVFLSGER